ncbi:MAG: DUF58 domain-containing protein [Candidatus Dormibacteria bacterium]
MTAHPTPRLWGYSALVAILLLGALVLARPALVALAAPFALWLVVGAALLERPRLWATVSLESERATEDEPLELHVELGGPGRSGPLEVGLDLPSELVAEGRSDRQRLLIRSGEVAELTIRIRPLRWGAYQLPPLTLAAQDPLSLFQFRGAAGESLRLRVYPAWERLRKLVPPARTQVYAGNRIARQHGEGLEFADIRPFVPGDRVRRVNWRVTARSGVPHVNDFHLERNADVILFIDNFTEIVSGRDSVLTLAVRAASALAHGYLHERDRVGVVGFGGLLRWLMPGMGPQHLYRVADALLDTEVVTSYAWRAIDVIPPRVLPPAATVIALTPLLDPRSVGALADLHHRGFDLLVLEIAPEGLLGSAVATVDPVAVRLWGLLRQARRNRLGRAGIAVTQWLPEEPLEVVLARAREYRRFAPRATA